MTKKRVISDLVQNLHKNQLATTVFQMPLNLHTILKVRGMWSPLWGRQNFPMVNLSCLMMKPTPLLSLLSRPGAPKNPSIKKYSICNIKNSLNLKTFCYCHWNIFFLQDLLQTDSCVLVQICFPGTSWTLDPHLWLRAILIRLKTFPLKLLGFDPFKLKHV